MRALVATIFVICILLIVGVVFIAVDSGSGTVIAVTDDPGVIMDLYKHSYLRTINAGKTKTYYTDIDYFAEVMVDSQILQVEITEREYFTLYTGEEVILTTYTTEGGISKNIYYTYSIKVFD